jgi:Cyclin, C-terminal domain
MEMKIFKALDYHLGKPLPIHFLRRYAKAAGSLGDRQYLASKYFLELAALDYDLTMIKPSEVSQLGTIWIAKKYLSNEFIYIIDCCWFFILGFVHY